MDLNHHIAKREVDNLVHQLARLFVVDDAINRILDIFARNKEQVKAIPTYFFNMLQPNTLYQCMSESKFGPK